MVNDLLIDHEYVLFCYNVLKSGKTIRIDENRLNEVKRLLSLKNKADLNEDDRVTVHRLSFIDKYYK